MTTQRLAIPAVIIALLVPMSAAPAAADEEPYNQDCQGVYPVALVCAGADAGTNVTCEHVTKADIHCEWSYGWNLLAKSDAQLPGGGVLNRTFKLESCIDLECTVHDMGTTVTECAWLVNAADPCVDEDAVFGELDFTLALGECVVLTAYVAVDAQAWALGDLGDQLSAHAADDSDNGGAECHLDDGRG